MEKQTLDQYGITPCANLRNADLGNADLTRADLRNVDLRGVNLRRANLIDTLLEGAIFEAPNGDIYVVGRGKLE